MKRTILVLFLMIPVLVFCQENFRVYFDSAADTPNVASAEALTVWINANKDAEIVKIDGYTDGIGSETDNTGLSQRRAQNIAMVITNAGISLNPGVAINGLGKTGISDDWQSRRVEIWYKKPQPKPVIEPRASKEIPIVVTELTTIVTSAKKGDKLVLPNLKFYGGTPNIKEESKPMLNELVQILKDNPNLKIDIQGHICCHKKETNLLSHHRAKTVYYYLIRKGIDKRRISTQGFEGKRPIYKIPEKNDEERVANRRVEIEVIEN